MDLAEQVVKLRRALEPFAAFADPSNTFPPDMRITAGSPMAKKQLTMGECYAARDLLKEIG